MHALHRVQAKPARNIQRVRRNLVAVRDPEIARRQRRFRRIRFRLVAGDSRRWARLPTARRANWQTPGAGRPAPPAPLLLCPLAAPGCHQHARINEGFHTFFAPVIPTPCRRSLRSFRLIIEFEDSGNARIIPTARFRTRRANVPSRFVFLARRLCCVAATALLARPVLPAVPSPLVNARSPPGLADDLFHRSNAGRNLSASSQSISAKSNSSCCCSFAVNVPANSFSRSASSCCVSPQST